MALQILVVLAMLCSVGYPAPAPITTWATPCQRTSSHEGICASGRKWQISCKMSINCTYMVPAVSKHSYVPDTDLKPHDKKGDTTPLAVAQTWQSDPTLVHQKCPIIGCCRGWTGFNCADKDPSTRPTRTPGHGHHSGTKPTGGHGGGKWTTTTTAQTVTISTACPYC